MRQEIRGNVGVVVNGDVYHPSTQALPPADPSVARMCPQCNARTWRFTQFCMHCKIDLFAWDHQRNVEYLRQELTSRAYRLLAGAGAFMFVSWAVPHQTTQVVSFIASIGLFIMAQKVLESRP